MLNYYWLPPKKRCVCCLNYPAFGQPASTLAPDSVIKTVHHWWKRKIFGRVSITTPIEAYRQWCNQNAHEGHPSSQWSSCLQEIRWVWRDLPRLDDILKFGKSVAYESLSSTIADEIKSRSSLDLSPATENSSWQSLMSVDRQEGLATRTRKAQRPLVGSIRFIFFEQMR